ncbi:MAG: aminopeptidase P family protein [Paludibacteraceae bacterium]|nr:aminopeptidase P family protein [Paludibacteraceae bacterium]
MKQLEDVRALMAQKHVDALIVPSVDPHGSEYVADHWRERAFISAFTGSAGTAVITSDGGCVWTDSRYFLQAGEQLKTSGLLLQKDGELGTPTISEWLGSTLKKGASVAINPQMIAINDFRNLQSELEVYGITLFTEFDFIDAVWQNRPAFPDSKTILLDERYSGQSTTDKLANLRKQLSDANVNSILLTDLGDVAWLYNMRGSDITYNPEIIALAIVTLNDATLFTGLNKVTEDMKDYLTKSGVEIRDYYEAFDALKSLSADTIIAIDPAKCNYALYKAISVKTKEMASPVFNTKCVKNATELEGTSIAMHRDAVALTRLFMWLEREMKAGHELTEISVSDRLHELRVEQGALDESFGTIAGYGPHGAIVHYEADEESNATLKPESFLLLDSGGQYMGMENGKPFAGTTDITRTVALGKPTEQMKIDYTLVLKGHLALGHQLFPFGTRGAQLDAIARQFLWNYELHYGHGTGHGVGHFLNCHEGPQSIRLNEVPAILRPGMIVSNEPGLYRAGVYGIRIENLVTVAEYDNNINEFAHFLHFRPLTLFPYDRESIYIEMLTPDELLQINAYHAFVFKEVSPLLNTEEREWLERKCAKL